MNNGDMNSDDVYSPIVNSKLRRGGTVIEDSESEDNLSKNTPRKDSQYDSPRNIPARRRKSNLSVITSIPPLTPHTTSTHPRVSILQEEEIKSVRRKSKSVPTSPMKSSTKEMFPSIISESPSDMSLANTPSQSSINSNSNSPPTSSTNISPIRRSHKDIYLPTITNAESEKYYDLKEVDEGEDDKIEIRT